MCEVHEELYELISGSNDSADELTYLLENKLEHCITDVHLYHALNKAAKDGNSNLVDILIENGAPVMESPEMKEINLTMGHLTMGESNPNPMVGAIFSGSPGILSTLINHGASVDHIYERQTLVMSCVLWNKTECLSLLIEHGADIHKPCNYYEPRMYSVVDSSFRLPQRRRFRRMQLGQGPHTPTSVAAYLGHLDVLKVGGSQPYEEHHRLP